MLKKVKVHLLSERHGVDGSLFEEGEDDALLLPQLWLPEEQKETAPEQAELLCEGRLRITPDLFSLSYEESALTGMEGSSTQLSFRLCEPTLVSMIRAGSVNTTLVFEKGRRHACTYQTPYMPFEICVYTLSLDNRLREDGTLSLDYIVEIHGAQAERCRMTLTVKKDNTTL